MRTTLSIDDELVAEACRITAVDDTAASPSCSPSADSAGRNAFRPERCQ
ncbi:type II toxin-antitoxin system VapB family antitoxin [Lentisalinibacter sediminis]